MNRHRIGFAALIYGLLGSFVWSIAAAPSRAAEPGSPYPHKERLDQAIVEALQNLAKNDSSSSLLTHLGDAYLRAGRCEDAVAQFELAIEQTPSIEPYLWQHGIALFFVGRHEDGKRLFEIHRKVNPNDVENAAWHFLCVAKADGIENARDLLLPAPGDRRVPMRQILERLAGGDQAEIQSAVAQQENKPGYDSAKLYGDLYVGLIADAEGDSKLATQRLRTAAETPLTNYMADVARVYAAKLNAESKP